MANTQRFIIGYTDQYGEDREVKSSSDFTIAACHLENLKRECPTMGYRMWEVVGGRASV